MQRIYLSIIGHSAHCILHRKYLIPARTDSRYEYSRHACINSAVELLSYQYLLHEETQPGGLVFQDRWKVSAILNLDFLLGSTILCLDLDYGLQSCNAGTNEDKVIRESAERALLVSYKIWLTKSGDSREAQKASEAIRIILGKSKREGMTLPGEVAGTIGKVPSEVGFGSQVGKYIPLPQPYRDQLTVNTAPAPSSFPPIPQTFQTYPHDFGKFPAIAMSPQDPAPLADNFNNSASSLDWVSILHPLPLLLKEC
jgi:hypothetical protein